MTLGTDRASVLSWKDLLVSPAARACVPAARLRKDWKGSPSFHPYTVIRAHREAQSGSGEELGGGCQLPNTAVTDSGPVTPPARASMSWEWGRITPALLAAQGGSQGQGGRCHWCQVHTSLPEDRSQVELDSFEKQSECQPCETDQSCSNHLELQVSASGGTEDVGNLLENHFSAGDASLEEKERALYAEAAPREKNLLLHSPDGREAESSEKTTAGASTAAPSPGSDPEASLSNTSASAPPGDPVEQPGASTFPPEGERGTGKEGRPELSAREGPAEEAEGQAGSGLVIEEAKEALGDNPAQGAAMGTAEPEGTGAFPVVVETAGEGIPGPDQGPDGPDGVMDVNTKAREGPEDQGESSPAVETGGTQEDRPLEGQAPGMLKEDLEAASSEEEGGGLSRGEEGGVPSQEESEEDSGHGASSEEAGGSSEEVGEPQEAAGAPSHGDEGAQLSSEEPNPGPEGDEVPEAEAEEPVEGPQGRGPRIAPALGQLHSSWKSCM